MILRLSDLTKVHEAAKALKAKMIVWSQNVVASIDFIGVKIALTRIDPSQLQSMPQRALAIEVRALSAFLKSVILTEFNIDETSPYDQRVWLDSGTNGGLEINMSATYDRWFRDIMIGAGTMDTAPYSPETEVTKELEGLFKFKSEAGVMPYTYLGHTMYLFYGVLPLLKGDKIFISLADINPTVFNIRFRVAKKSGFVVTIYLNFLNLEHRPY